MSHLVILGDNFIKIVRCYIHSVICICIFNTFVIQIHTVQVIISNWDSFKYSMNRSICTFMSRIKNNLAIILASWRCRIVPLNLNTFAQFIHIEKCVRVGLSLDFKTFFVNIFGCFVWNTSVKMPTGWFTFVSSFESSIACRLGG